MATTLSLDILDRVRVASPCPKRWDDMVGDDRKRFCSDCRLSVYNLSAMSREEAAELIAKSDGHLCAYFWRRADGTILTQDCPVGLAAVRAKTAAAMRRIAAAVVLVVGGGLMLGASKGSGWRLRQVQPFAAVCNWLDPQAAQTAWRPVGTMSGGSVGLAPLSVTPAPTPQSPPARRSTPGGGAR